MIKIPISKKKKIITFSKTHIINRSPEVDPDLLKTQTLLLFLFYTFLLLV